MLLESLAEVKIYGEVRNLLLELLEALFEVIILVCLGENNLFQGLLGLKLDCSDKSLDVLYGLLLLCVLLIKHDLDFHQGK